ncbi:hypothetical protein EVAR_53503_1 [Eumeta japonica]|uniref:Uncharacterized protein n=1 Tax=Eumeta variegata TaxID=151549 RepID=A0A4C1Y8F5_EUMVA|nr:hypothetical protein EVAR_53503_1 [Eumeta japonica]
MARPRAPRARRRRHPVTSRGRASARGERSSAMELGGVRAELSVRDQSRSSNGTFTRRMGKEEKEDSGFGFKDRAKAEETLRLLERHDLNYRRLTVRGLLGRARRVLSQNGETRCKFARSGARRDAYGHDKCKQIALYVEFFVFNRDKPKRMLQFSRRRRREKSLTPRSLLSFALGDGRPPGDGTEGSKWQTRCQTPPAGGPSKGRLSSPLTADEHWPVR